MADQTATTISVMGIIGFINEMKYVGEKPVLEISIYEKTWNGTEEVSEAISISIWGNDALLWEPLLRVGMRASARGTVKTETFQRKNGEEGSKRKVSVREFIAIDMKTILSGSASAPAKPAADDFDEYMGSDGKHTIHEIGRGASAKPVSSDEWKGDVPF